MSSILVPIRRVGDVTEWGCGAGNALPLCSVRLSARTPAILTDWLSHSFPQPPPHVNSGMRLRLGCDCFVPNPSQFATYLSSSCSAVCSLCADGVVKFATRFDTFMEEGDVAGKCKRDASFYVPLPGEHLLVLVCYGCKVVSTRLAFLHRIGKCVVWLISILPCKHGL